MSNFQSISWHESKESRAKITRHHQLRDFAQMLPNRNTLSHHIAATPVSLTLGRYTNRHL